MAARAFGAESIPANVAATEDRCDSGGSQAISGWKYQIEGNEKM